jgi:hypothetical protein
MLLGYWPRSQRYGNDEDDSEDRTWYVVVFTSDTTRQTWCKTHLYPLGSAFLPHVSQRFVG